jgi:hypothetical protein
MMPVALHDESARQEFAAAMRTACMVTLAPGNAEVYRRRVRPRLEHALGRELRTRHEVRRAMLAEPYHRYWGALARTTQEMLWDVIGASVERQLPALIARARAIRGRGSLRLDPSLVIPRYVAQVDIHVMPGNYQTDLAPDDVYAGALYNRGVHVYGMGALGPTGAG